MCMYTFGQFNQKPNFNHTLLWFTPVLRSSTYICMCLSLHFLSKTKPSPVSQSTVDEAAQRHPLIQTGITLSRRRLRRRRTWLVPRPMKSLRRTINQSFDFFLYTKSQITILIGLTHNIRQLWQKNETAVVVATLSTDHTGGKKNKKNKRKR